MKTLNQRPESQAIPENRNGTRTFVKYSKHVGGDIMTRTTLGATQRQWNKALKLVRDQDLRPSQVKGRVLRACAKMINASCDFDQYSY